MKFWQSLVWMEPDQMLDVARFAEEVGFEGVVLADHGVFPRDVKARYPYSDDGLPPMHPDSWYPDCWVSIASMAATTRRLKFTVSIYVLPLRNVFEVARATGSLDIFSEGRFSLGVGAGWMKDEFEIYGVDFHTRGKRMDEMIEILRKFWQGGWVEHHGNVHDFDAVQISPAPHRQVPIWVGGDSPAALKRAARNDGWLSTGNTPEEAAELLETIARHRRELGREHLPFDAMVGVKAKPDPDLYGRLEELGMTCTSTVPFAFTLGKTSTVDQKKREMEQFAENIIRRFQ